MKWNWQQKDWPKFSYEPAELKKLEEHFLRQSGLLFGVTRHIVENEKQQLIIDLICDEALKTTEIEGEYLNRDSVQSSLRKNFGLTTKNQKIAPAEQGISEMMVDLYRNFAMPLTHTTLSNWHKMLTKGRRDLTDIGKYRTHKEPMQVVSGPIGKTKIHFEAPPSKNMKKEMDRFIKWFNQTAPNGKEPLPALTRASMVHHYFVCIHPFEDGNGRIGRALSEKALAQSLDQPTLIALSRTIEKGRKTYYKNLEQSNKDNKITDWLAYFSKTILEAQEYSQTLVDFLIEKTKLFDRVRGQLNERQEKVVTRIFREGREGFKGGLSAENYISITGTSKATATRDLQDLVKKSVLTRQGELKSTRYYLKLK
ncbi:MAG: Fic family protein [Nitrospinae bacterium]|nr:Fic family protein [Nitrospinota bacterium]